MRSWISAFADKLSHLFFEPSFCFLHELAEETANFCSSASKNIDFSIKYRLQYFFRVIIGRFSSNAIYCKKNYSNRTSIRDFSHWDTLFPLPCSNKLFSTITLAPSVGEKAKHNSIFEVARNANKQSRKK